MRLVAMFPARSGLNVEVLQLRNRGADYPAIRLAACQLLQGGHLNEVLAASYTHLIVDEYQDCNLVQHAMVTALSIVLPACVLGDIRNSKKGIDVVPGNVGTHPRRGAILLQ